MFTPFLNSGLCKMYVCTLRLYFPTRRFFLPLKEYPQWQYKLLLIKWVHHFYFANYYSDNFSGNFNVDPYTFGLFKLQTVYEKCQII